MQLKLRLSNHNLMIETGRHKKLERGMRVCPLCHKGVEDEVHFLFLCDTYNIQRDKLLNSLNLLNTSFQFYSNNQKLELIMLTLPSIFINALS